MAVTFSVTANTEKGEYSINSFEVRESVPFDVRRVAPTRVYPYVDHQCVFILKPLKIIRQSNRKSSFRFSITQTPL